MHVADIDAESAANVAEELEDAVAHTVDCSDPAAVEAFAGRVFDAEGRVDVLHNNAGIGHAGDLEATTPDDWRRVIDVNLLGVAYGIQAFAPRMLATGARASIVNTASGAGLFGLPRMAPYCASKFGVVGLSEALDAELAPHGIRVSAICPGIVDTAIIGASTIRGGMADEREEIASFYRRRGASPDEVAETVLAAVERPRPVRTVPVSHVAPLWVLKRISPRLGGFVVRAVTRLRSRG